jgi:hypothetical protein
MAIFHQTIQIISRGKGKSAVAAAAYRSGEVIKNEYDGVTHDFTAKRGIVHTEILLPDHAPAEYSDRAVLWNSVEKNERYKTAQLSREIEIALPVELNREQQISLARRYVQDTFVRAGMCADICIHDKEDGNPHAHIMLTMRPIDEHGAWGAKSRTVDGKKINTTDWSEQTKAEEWRRAWAAYANGALRIAGVLTEENTLDHRSYERQGIDKIPSIHLGVAASQMERKGIRTERGNINREIEISNKQLRQVKARISHLKDWLKTESANTAPPTLTDIISEILNSEQGANRYAKIRDLKSAAAVLNFLTANHITDMAGLNAKVNAMDNQFEGVRENLKKAERRISTLDEHLRHSGNYKSYRGYKAQYEKLYAEYKTAKSATGLFAERKAQKALDTANEYHETHRAEIGMFENAERYLRDVLQARFDTKKLPPIAKWKEERAAKIAEKTALNSDYYRLREEVKNAEAIRRTVEQLTREDEPRKAKTRSHEIGL